MPTDTLFRDGAASDGNTEGYLRLCSGFACY